MSPSPQDHPEILPYRPPTTAGALALLSPSGIVPVEDPDTEVAEAFLRLSSFILVSAQSQALRSIGVTSAHRGEGRTTSALNLAICLGKTQGGGGRVLLVDGDTRERTLTQWVGQRSGEEPEGEDPVLLPTPFPGVDLMTAPTRSDALTLHDPGAWSQAIRALVSRYRLLVVDCPAVLGSAEGLVLPSCVDQLVFVVLENKTSRADLQRAIELVGKEPLGVILNRGGSHVPVGRRP